MNEQLRDLMEAARRAAGQVTEQAVDAANFAGQKAGQLLSVGKLNVKLMELKGKIDTQLHEVGAMMYATHTGTPTESEELLAKLEEIDGLHAQLRSANAELAALRGTAVCPACGAAAQPGDQFCRECGGAL